MTPSLPRDAASVDLDACAREPIHIPGAVQPHGLLFVLDPDDLRVVQISENVRELRGEAPEAVLGKPVGELVGREQASLLHVWLHEQDLSKVCTFLTPLRLGGSATEYEAYAHRTRGGIVVELEPMMDGAVRGDGQGELHTAVERLQGAESLDALCSLAVAEVRRMTGFDRVKMYRFDAQWNGQVVAEDRAEHIPTYLGLYFPASDIPEQARRLYTLNRVRIISDAAYQPAAVVPELNPLTGGPLDMSKSLLRSVSPVHLEYLRNMGVGASMSISIVQDGRLWGLIACHHAAPRLVPYSVRSTCVLLAQVVALLLDTELDLEARRHAVRLRTTQARLLERMLSLGDFAEGLTGETPNMLDLLAAQGGAIVEDERCTFIGQTPAEPEVRALVAWLAETMEDDVLATDELSRLYPPAAAFQEVASGLLVVSLSRRKPYFLLWFRPEAPKTVKWAGNPNKSVREGEGDRLHPRKSFAAWVEKQRGRSHAWKGGEIEAAHELRHAIIDVVLARSEELARLNASLEASNAALKESNVRLLKEVASRKRAEDELARANVVLRQRNRELQNFAYVASHDLQEPLRKIRTFGGLLRSESEARLGEESLFYLGRMERAAEYMSSLLNDLLAFSKVATEDIPFQQVDLNAALAEVRGDMADALAESGARVESDEMPVIEANPVQVQRLLRELLGNAVRFRRPEAELVIRIGAQVKPATAETKPVCWLTVEDNGIGFDEKYLDRIFLPFQQLHGRSVYPGTGVGLAICQRIVDHHGGTITAQSTPGAGSTFIVKLPVRQELSRKNLAGGS